MRAAQRRIRALPYWPRKVVTLLLGGLVFVAGVVMLVAPGPGVATIGLSIVIFAGEFAWAKRAWKWLAQTARWFYRRVMGSGDRVPGAKD